jgi:hypothetical protein
MVKNFLYLVIFTGLLSIFPVNFAHADEIRFYANTTEVNLGAIGIICQGPFFRTSLCVALEPPGPGRFNGFYSAEINFFPPFGKWICSVYPDPICFASSTGHVNFCVTQSVFDTKGSVEITIKETNEQHFSVKSNYSDKCDSASTNAFLGDRPQQSKSDKDTFSFSDTEGDEVTLKLEEDGSVGHIGQEATFKLRGPAGTSLNELKTGELPLEIMATIPKSGDYEIEVDQKGIPDNTRYRGGYIITLDSSLNDVNEIDPSQDVE